eukprot:m.235230 g.235230  ORF g.235230 m.235230 type:complete len:130 (-) comp15760_c0_seq2:2306-2695(-)
MNIEFSILKDAPRHQLIILARRLEVDRVLRKMVSHAAEMNVDQVLKVSLPRHMAHGSLHEKEHILASWHAGKTRSSPAPGRASIGTRSSHRVPETVLPEVAHVSLSHREDTVAAALMACAEAQRNGEWA